MKRKRLKIKWKNIFLLLLIYVFIISFILSGIKLIRWYKDSKYTEEKIESINEVVTINKVTEADEIKIVQEEETISKADPYWDYIKLDLIDVDINELKKINSNTVGWISVKNTNINYPFVQTNDNEFYLKHSFDNSKNNAGWVFMDYRNNHTEFDKNTILYAHGRLDNTMFGTLKNIFNSEWINDANNHVINLSTENENTLWQVFSIYKIVTTNDYIQTIFTDDNDFQEFGNMLLNRSQYNFNTSINSTDKILTLSTCYNEEEKVVLHAKLIKIAKK